MWQKIWTRSVEAWFEIRRWVWAVLDGCCELKLQKNMIFDIFFKACDNLGCIDTPFLATCRCLTRIPARLTGLRCSSGVVFFFFCFSDMALTWHWCGVNMPAVKKKTTTTTTKFQDFDRWTNPYRWFCHIPLSEKWEVRNLKSETHIAQPLISFCPLLFVPRGRYIRPIGESASSLYPFRSLSLSLSRHGQVRASLLSLSLCFAIFFFFLLFADCFGPLAWCTVACYIYNTQSFFLLLF